MFAGRTLKGLTALLLVTLVVGLDDDVGKKTTTLKPTTTAPTTQTPTTTTLEPTTSTTAAPTTSSTPATTSSSTAAPTTPTTTAPTTAAPTTPTTTAPTTTTPLPTTAAPPGPIPDPEIGKWQFFDNKTKISCVIVQMAAQFNITYIGAAREVIFNLPKNITMATSGSCGAEEQNILLQWPSVKGENSTAFFSFKKNGTSSAVYSLTALTFNLSLDALGIPNQLDSYLVLKHSEKFAVPIHKSYRCSKKQVVELESSSADYNATLTLKSLQLEAFHGEKGDMFDSAEECEIADVSDVVAIAVGCSLVGLILIVIIVYLVSRRRSQTRGYLSM